MSGHGIKRKEREKMMKVIKKYLKTSVGLGLLAITLVSVANTDQDVRQALNERKVVLAQSKSWNIQQLEQRADDRANQYRGLVDSIRHKPLQGGMQSTQKRGGKVADGAILFVSLGMPKKLLRQYLKESMQYHISVVIRGLIQNNFRATMSAIYNLIKGRHLPGVSIDPIWFREFGIHQVPALVVTSNPNHCASVVGCKQPYDVVYGNLSIKALLTKIAEDGQGGKQVANNILGSVQ